MHEEHRANPENTRRKTKKKQKRKPIHRLITKRKRGIYIYIPFTTVHLTYPSKTKRRTRNMGDWFG